MIIRVATAADWPTIWTILKPVFAAGETYAVDRKISADKAHAMWMDAPKATFVSEADGQITGTYYIKTNAQGGGAHVCNCGYVVADHAQGQGIARAMCEHSQTQARDLDYTAMQFNMVLATNTGAVALWQKLGFETVGTLPGAFDHPTAGLTDGYVMFKKLA
jgi:L-amino acid N-acyltransferase YncA